MAENDIANNRMEMVRAAKSVNIIYLRGGGVAMSERVPRRKSPYPVQRRKLINVAIGNFNVLEGFAENERSET